MTTNSYDGNGQKIATTTGDKEGKETQTTVELYDLSGNVVAAIDHPEGAEENYSVGENSIVTTSTYDSLGNKLSETDAMGNETAYAYDEQSRLIKVTLPEQNGKKNETTYAYDIPEEGNQSSVQVTYANGASSKEYTNEQGQNSKITDFGKSGDKPLSTAYEYDKSGNCIKETFQNGSYKKNTYDGRDRLTETRYFNGAGQAELVTKYTYDSSDHMLTMADYQVNGNKETLYQYQAFTYDGFGQMTGSAQWDGSTVPTEAELQTVRIQYTYDKDGKVTSVTYPKEENGVKGLRFTYNSSDWLTEIHVQDDNGTKKLLRSYTYMPDGKTKEIKDYRSFQKGSTTDYILRSYSYDRYDRVTKISHTDSSSPEAEKETYTYTYDKNSNILTEQIKNHALTDTEKQMEKVLTHVYDNLGQLLSTTTKDAKSGKTEKTAYTYDAVGNRLKESVTEGSRTTEETSYAYNGLNQLLTSITTSPKGNTSNKSYVYDANGNEKKVTDSVSGIVTENTYDIDNRLSKAVIQNGKKAVLTQENQYDGNGQRVKKTENGKTTHYQYQNQAVLSTTDDKGNKTSFNLLGAANQPIATMRYQGNYAGKIYFYQKDIKGSTTSISDETGTGVISYDYNDFGETTKAGDANFFNEVCYTGGIYDESTGLYYLNARYYNPEDGRFLTQDTYRGEDTDPGTWHLYAYCANNPVNYTDPSGHDAVTIITGVKLFVVVTTYVYVNHVRKKKVSIRTYKVSKSYWDAHRHDKYLGHVIVSVVLVVKTKQVIHKAKQTIVKTTSKLKNKIKQSKGGKQRIRDTGLAGESDETIRKRARDKSLSPEERNRYNKEEKARKARNKKKRNSHY